MSIGKMVRAHRRSCAMTQRDLAEKSGISQQAIIKIEGGKVTPKESTLEAFAAAMGITRLALDYPPRPREHRTEELFENIQCMMRELRARLREEREARR